MGTARMAAADRKTEIMDAAVARIVTAGFEGLRVRDVAQDVGINNATLHHHFPTKAALVRALVQRFLEGFPVDDAIPGDNARSSNVSPPTSRTAARGCGGTRPPSWC